MLLNRGKVKAAIASARGAARLAPFLLSAQHVLAVTLSRGGSRTQQEAVEVVNRMFRTDPTSPLTHETAGVVALGERQWQVAEQHFREALQITPTTPTWPGSSASRSSGRAGARKPVRPTSGPPVRTRPIRATASCSAGSASPRWGSAGSWW